MCGASRYLEPTHNSHKFENRVNISTNLVIYLGCIPLPVTVDDDG